MQNECSVHIIIMAANLLRGFSDYILLAYWQFLHSRVLVQQRKILDTGNNILR